MFVGGAVGGSLLARVEGKHQEVARRGGNTDGTCAYEVQEAGADRHEQEHEQEQDKHAQDKHEQELSSSGRQWRPKKKEEE